MLFLGIDLGTSYFKAGVFDRFGKMLGFGRFAVPGFGGAKVARLTHTDFISLIRKCVDTAIDKAEVSREDIVSVSYGSQANSFILLDKFCNEIAPFTLWNHGQGSLIHEISDFASPKNFKDTTGIGIDISAQFLINRLAWSRQAHPELFDQVAHVLTMPDYFCFRLTGSKIVDASTASLTGLLDFKKSEWWRDAIDVAGVKGEQLSEVMPLSAYAGQAVDDNFLELKKGTMFCCGGLDHHVAAIGAGVGKFFDVSESTGTVIAAIEHSSNCNVQQHICLAKGLSGSKCFRMAFDENGAVVLEWYRKNHASDLSFDDLGRLAESVNENCDGLVALPRANVYEGLEGFQNIQPMHHHGHFVRAIMESTANSLLGIFDGLMVHPGAKIVSTGGGAKSLLWRQIKNHVTGKDLATAVHGEASCFGAAMIAASGAGFFNSIYDVQDAWLKADN